MRHSWAPGSRLHSMVRDPNVKCAIMVSAHHICDAEEYTVLIGADEDAVGRNGILWDYGGSARGASKYSMQNPGSPELAAKIFEALRSTGIKCEFETGRGFDHGAFQPLISMEFPSHIPVVKVSLAIPTKLLMGVRDEADYQEMNNVHAKMGEVIATASAAEGALLIGSGMSFHNKGFFRSRSKSTFIEKSRSFHASVKDLIQKAQLEEWHKAKYAFDCHPTPDHFLPLMVCYGAAKAADRQKMPKDTAAVLSKLTPPEIVPFSVYGMHLSHFIFA